jgi:hydrogenase expression/formation protein HypD
LIHVDEYRDGRAVEGLARIIDEKSQGLEPLTFMEVCGTHTMCAARYGIKNLLPDSLRLLSGPGCPVCVTPNSYLDTAIAMSGLPELVVTTFGDMFRVPGSNSSLVREKADGHDIRIVYSPLESLEIAARNKEKRVVFLGIGFETTAPAVAATVLAARRSGLKNWFLLSGHKTIPGVMEMLASSTELRVDGFICPGHVSAVIGCSAYEPLARKYRIPCVVTGFEPVDMLQAIYMLVEQRREGRSEVENEYRRVVERKGNEKAVSTMLSVFEECDSEWRGIGSVDQSGLRLREEFGEYDAARKIEVTVDQPKEYPGCICGEILKGIRTPRECALFGTECTPADPKGACMVSSEGTCAAYYKFPVLP